MSTRVLIAAVIAIGWAVVSAGDAAAQGRGGHCSGGQTATSPGMPGSQNPQMSSQTQLAQMRSSYNQQVLLAQMRVASQQQMQAAQFQAQLQAKRPAAANQTATKQTNVKLTTAKDSTSSDR